jgi:hypothetical protein
MKGDLLAEVHQKTVTTTVKDISQSGIKFDINSEVQTSGKVKARGLSTVSIWQKTDGTSEWENKGMLTTAEGDFIAVWGKGTGKNTGPTTASWEGETHFMSQSPKLAWLNNVKAWSEGTADQTKAESVARIYQQK